MKGLMLLIFVLFSFSVSAQPLFDVSVSLLPEFGEVEAGGNLIVTTKFINQGISEAKDVLMEYTVYDHNRENKIVEISETVAVQTTFSNVKHIYIPNSLSEGKYFINVKVLYDGKEASASSNFYVKSASEYGKKLVIYLLIGLLVIFVIFTIGFYRFTQKMIQIGGIKKWN